MDSGATVPIQGSGATAATELERDERIAGTEEYVGRSPMYRRQFPAINARPSLNFGKGAGT
jgi:hypothetical protein